MAWSFPASLDTFATNKQDDIDAKSGLDLGLSTTVGDHAQHHNDLAGALMAVEATIGPSAASMVFMYTGKQAADLTNSSLTVPSNTDMVFTYVANATYVCEIFALCQSAAATTGYGFALDTSTAISSVGLTFYHQLANTGTLSGGSSIADNTITGVSSGLPGATTNVPVHGGGLLITSSTGGTATLTFRAEVAAAATLKAGSVMRVQRIA